MEHDSIVKALGNELLYARDVFGREIGSQFDLDIALGGLQRQFIACLGHGVSLDFLILSPAVASGASTPSLQAEGEAIQESRTDPGLLRQLRFLAMTA
jgi:hypothetical protein